MDNRHSLSITEAVKYGFETLWKHVGFLLKTLLVTIGIKGGVFTLAGLLNIPLFQGVIHLINQVRATLPGLKEEFAGLADVQEGVLRGGLLQKHAIVASRLKELLLQYSPRILLALLLLSLVGVALHLGWKRIALDLNDKRKSSLDSLFYGFKILFKGFLASVLYALAVGAGFFLLFLPGIYVATRLQFWGQSLVDRDSSITGSLRHSWNISRNHFWPLLGFLVVWGAIYFLSGIITAVIPGISFPLQFLVNLALIPAYYLSQTRLYRKLQPK